MPRPSSRIVSLASPLLVFLLLAALAPAPAGAADQVQVSRFAARMKALHQKILLEREGKEFGDKWRNELEPGRGHRAKPAKTGDLGAPGTTPLSNRAAPFRSLVSLAPNVRVSDPTSDPSGATQSETAIGALGDNVLIAFNDGPSTSPGYQGYAYSLDGGQSFTDGGAPPIPSGWTWSSDPVITVNESTGDFWFLGLADKYPNNGLVLVKANFTGGAPVWGAPSVVRQFPNDQVSIDKPWMAVDPGSGALHVIYTAFEGFFFSGDTIDVQSSADGGVNWTDPIQLSKSTESGYVQGARVGVGPAGEVYAVWYVIANLPPFRDSYVVRKSTNGGASYTPEATVAQLFSNFGTGAPGFNRPRGVTFPSLAVDRSSGPHRGRVYVAWNECVDFYNDPLGENPGPGVIESEPNDTPAQANTFALGDSIRGTMLSGQVDFFKFTATQGQTVIAYAGNVDPTLDLSLRILCSDGNAQLALSEVGAGLGALVVFTIPADGTYYLRVKSVSGGGAYTVYTGLHVITANDRARDHRDAFVTSSDDGLVWSNPARMNSDSPWLDNWLPEIAVSNLSELYAVWYDWRDASATICNAQSEIYLAHSTDGGASWSEFGVFSDAPSDWTDWTGAKSFLQPNQGDYVSLFADCQAVYAAWGDLRGADVDVWTARYPPGFQSAVVVFARAAAVPSHVDLTWQAQPVAPLTGNVYRRPPGGGWTQIGTFNADGAGTIFYSDATVTAGSAYEYRLGVNQVSGELLTCAVRVDVPLPVVNLSLGFARPNPTQGDIIVTFTLPTNLPATLRLLDLTGREVKSMEVGSLGPGRPTVNLGTGLDLRSGIYFLHLRQAGHETSARVSVVR